MSAAAVTPLELVAPEGSATPDLTALVREAWDEGLADPREIASWVVDRLADEHLREALKLTLKPWVMHIGRREQRSTPKMAVGGRAGKSRWEREQGDVAVYARLECPNGEWKPLGDCTREEVRALGKYRLKLAESHKREAGRFGLLSKTMNERDATVVRDLPADLVTEILNA